MSRHQFVRNLDFNAGEFPPYTITLPLTNVTVKLELDDYDAAYDEEAYLGNISISLSCPAHYSLTRILEMSENEQSNQADVFRAEFTADVAYSQTRCEKD